MRQPTIVLIGLLACVLFAAWFFTTHEKVTSTEYVGYHGEARFNDFLAAEMLLNELGIGADSHSSLTPSDWLPGEGDTLITRVSPTISVDVESFLLLDWATNGGHLVLLPPHQDSVMTDDLAARLGFGYTRLDPDEFEPVEPESEPDPAELDAEDWEEWMRFWEMPYRISVVDEAAFAQTLSDDHGVIAARRRYGSGFVTVIANSSYFSNGSIREPENARLLLDTVDGWIEPGKVWLVFSAKFPSLWQVIWSAAPWVVIGSALLLAAWLWSVMPRFGPPITAAPPVRRSIIEHVGAAGHFVWRNQGAAALASSSAAAVLHEAEVRHPGIGRLSAERQAEQIARMTNLPAQAILDVLVDQDEPRHREFTQNMRALQRIRKEL